MTDAHAPTQGPIPGADPAERAVAIAGLLAELGIQALQLTALAGAPPFSQTLPARSTDLPGLLARHAPCRLAAPGLTIDVAPDAARWHASPELAPEVARRLL